MKKNILCGFICALIAWPVFAMHTPEINTEKYFEKIKKDPLQLYMFLLNFPKGGDLHNHFAGATYAENLILYGKDDDFCVNLENFSLFTTSQCPQAHQLSQAANNPNFYRSLIDNWSMNEFVPGGQSGEAHFFATFEKFYPVSSKHPIHILSEIKARVGAEHIKYLELMANATDLSLDDKNLTKSLAWQTDLAKMRTDLLQKPEFTQLVEQIPKRLDVIEKEVKNQLHCDTANPDPGCQVKVRYQYFALRELPPEKVFAALLTGFELAKKDPRFVGVNIVMPEDGPTSMKDYDLHMQMFKYLHTIYPNVHISLHAGELAPASVPPEKMQDHIRKAIEIGQAERIGHGVAIAYENNAQQLLKDMAAKQIMVEINLTSNLAILGIEGAKHPLQLYLQSQVPVALSTDDEGVLRTNLTHEYERAVQTYNLDYPTLKILSRNSLTYSFLPGKSLWQNSNSTKAVSQCEHDVLGGDNSSPDCQVFISTNEKAKMQWQLEGEFRKFEETAKNN